MVTLNSIDERRAYAVSCSHAIQERYAALLYGGDMQKAANVDDWQIVENGRIIEKTYPLKYSYLYNRYFFQEVFDGDVSSIWPWLDDQFPELDTIDVEYIQSLIQEAKEYGFFKEGWICVIRGDGRTTVHDNVEEARRMHSFSSATTNERFYGGGQNRQRRKYLNKWLIARTQPAHNDSISKRKHLQSSTLWGVGDASDIPEPIAFHYGFTAEKVDQVAERLELIANGQFALKTAHKSALTGFIEGLREYKVLTYTNLKAAHRFFGARYGVDVNTDRVTKIRTHYQSKTLQAARRLFPLNQPRN